MCVPDTLKQNSGLCGILIYLYYNLNCSTLPFLLIFVHINAFLSVVTARLVYLPVTISVLCSSLLFLI